MMTGYILIPNSSWCKKLTFFITAYNKLIILMVLTINTDLLCAVMFLSYTWNRRTLVIFQSLQLPEYKAIFKNPWPKRMNSYWIFTVALWFPEKIVFKSWQNNFFSTQFIIKSFKKSSYRVPLVFVSCDLWMLLLTARPQADYPSLLSHHPLKIGERYY